MEIDRRTFTSALAVSAALLPLPRGGAIAGEKRVFLSSARVDGQDEARFFTADGELIGRFTLPDRGHGGAMHPRRAEAVLFARRPGTFAFVFDRLSGEPLQRIDAPERRHFYGHGTFSADGRLLYAAENDYDTARGAIGVYDAAGGYARLGELDSHGVGPHDVKLMPDGRTLVVANGGILTHPDTGRRKLNIADMDPSLCLVDAASGALVFQGRLDRELHKLSIRHLGVAPSGKVVAVMQYEGAPDDQVPLVITLDGERLEIPETPATVLARMRNYCGSVALDAAGEIAAVSCPRGGLVTFWSMADGTYMRSTELADGCGVAPAGAGNGFLVSSGTGVRIVVDPVTGTRRRIDRNPATQWDNHITSG